METVCITGIGGYLGLATAFKLLEAGYTVVGIGSSGERPTDLPKGIEYAQVDIRDEGALADFFSQHEVAVVYHFAAIKFVGKCEAEPELCYDINTKGTKMVLAAMQTANVPHIIYASTYAVYDWTGDQITLTENSLTTPVSVYGKSKLQSEIAIVEAGQSGKIARYHILRYGNIVGAVPQLAKYSAQSFLDKMIYATRTGGTITLNGGDHNTPDGTLARDFIDIRDVAQANVSVLSDSTSALYNVSSGTATTLKQLITLCELVTGESISVVVNPKTGTEPASIVIDHSKLTSVLNFIPQFPLEETVATINQKLVT